MAEAPAPADQESIDLSDAEYLVMQSHVALIARMVIEIDGGTLEAFIARAERADSIGPLLDPSLWMLGHEGLRGVITHARALARCRRDILATL